MNIKKDIESEITYQPIKKLGITNLTATVLGIGYIKYAPGTFGSLVGLLDFSVSIYFLHTLNFFYIPFIILTSYYFINSYCNITKKHDPKEVVLDEYAGQYLACFLAYFLLDIFNSGAVKLYDNYIINVYVIGLSFIFFRFFDITKLSLVGYYDRKSDSFSVLMDDLVAGVFAGILTALIFALI
ncbi:MAG: phosphatidylglycerophosphatase A [Rickettsiales bacterium]|jgi:phosphatidylglycerophosphatase A|nr:phosphatidylglycerophosphatase A [Rickettsiales bacterium]